MNKLYQWIGQQRPLLAEESPVAKAMNYLVNHREPLSRFLDDGQLRLDNNLSELALRRQVVGRANWTFCDSDDGAEWNAIATSLIASSQLHGIERWAYLRDVLTLLPAWPSSAVLQLAPKFWQQTRQELQTQQRLSAARLLGRSTRPMRRSLWLQASRCTNAVHRTRTITSSGIACFVARSHEFNTMDRTRASVVLLELVAGIALTVA